MQANDVRALKTAAAQKLRECNYAGAAELFARLFDGDTAIVLPWMVVTAVFIIAFNLLADVLYGVLDPRIRY